MCRRYSYIYSLLLKKKKSTWEKLENACVPNSKLNTSATFSLPGSSLVQAMVVSTLTIKLTLYPVLLILTISYSSLNDKQQKWHKPKSNVNFGLFLFPRTTVLLFIVSISLVSRSLIFKVFSVVCQARNRSLRFSYTFPTPSAGVSRKPVCFMICNGESPRISPRCLLQWGVSMKSVLLFAETSSSLAWIQLQNWSL